MSKKSKFIEFVDDALFSKVDINEVDSDIVAYWEALKGTGDVEKPTFTDNGKLVMEYLKGLPEGSPALKSREIAEALFVSSRSVSGAMRKLVTDGFVEKIGQDPVMYSLTEKGKNIEIN
jgi:DNA-binding MarR family transcriptional regulator